MMSEKEGREFAEKRGFRYIETSAKTGTFSLLFIEFWKCMCVCFNMMMIVSVCVLL